MKSHLETLKMLVDGSRSNPDAWYYVVWTRDGGPDDDTGKGRGWSCAATVLDRRGKPTLARRHQALKTGRSLVYDHSHKLFWSPLIRDRKIVVPRSWTPSLQKAYLSVPRDTPVEVLLELTEARAQVFVQSTQPSEQTACVDDYGTGSCAGSVRMRPPRTPGGIGVIRCDAHWSGGTGRTGSPR